jgi:hypothetical protein
MDNINMTDKQLRQLIDGLVARLMTLLNLYQDREEYEKCHLVNKHIKKLEKIVENL